MDEHKISMSGIKENSDTSSTPSPAGRAGEGLARSVANVVSGSFLSQESTLKSFPFIFYLSLLAICYIAYGYYSDDQVRKVNQLTSQIKELRTQYIVTKDSLVVKSKQTEVANALEHTGIKESVVPPKKILIAPPNLPKGEE